MGHRDNARSRGRRASLLVLVVAAVAVIAGAAGALAANGFSDVPDGHTFEEDIAWMADAGITEGYADGTFRPMEPVRRQAMAAFMARLAGADPDVAPMVDAASLGGTDAADVHDELAALRSDVDALADLPGKVATLEATVADQQAEIAALESTVADLEALLADVSRSEVGGRDTLRFTGMNVQIVDGSGDTDGTPSGVGNLIVGYDAARTSGSDKSGSHYVVVGDEHNYTAFGGLVAGSRNHASGDAASVLGGSGNRATGTYATVAGGGYSEATGTQASIAGGYYGTASGPASVVSGGRDNTASGREASVSGGRDNTSGGTYASILGGDGVSVSTTWGIHPHP